MRIDAARLTSAAAFLVPGLALWLPSGYSYGAGLLLVGALVWLRGWTRLPTDSRTWWLALSWLAMGSVWLLDASSGDYGLRGVDRPSKYLIALLSLFFVAAHAPRIPWFWAGLAVGAAGSGIVAIYQMSVLGLSRATGFTNAIQYGDLSLYLGLACAVMLLGLWGRWRPWQRVTIAVAMLLGLYGSLLSSTRGGWIVVPVAVPLAALALARFRRSRQAVRGIVAALVVSAGLVSLTAPEISERVAEARQDVAIYMSTGNAATSVGQRVAHWKLAWEMGLDRPWTGWGLQGYAAEKQRRVEAGLAHPYVLQFGHAHNEVMDLWAKRGGLGVAVLLCFYAVPLALFWPLRRRVLRPDGSLDTVALCLRIVGTLLPVSYIGFGLTQVFLSHNSGNMFYLFMCMLVHGMLLGRERSAATAAH